jgi:pimeloyl-ACP methyl ester carboxylesterase
MYFITGKRKWLEACIMPMALTKDNIDQDTFETAKLSIDHAKIKVGMPSNVKSLDMKKCVAPTLVIAAEKDCLFPANKVIPRAMKIIPNCTTYLLENKGHINALTDIEKQMIINFFKNEIDMI